MSEYTFNQSTYSEVSSINISCTDMHQLTIAIMVSLESITTYDESSEPSKSKFTRGISGNISGVGRRRNELKNATYHLSLISFSTFLVPPYPKGVLPIYMKTVTVTQPQYHLELGREVMSQGQQSGCRFVWQWSLAED